MSLNVQSPWFEAIARGEKVVEGRLNRGTALRIIPGQYLMIHGPGGQSIQVRVTAVTVYPTFGEMLEAEGLNRVLPGVDRVEDGERIYRQFYTVVEEMTHGVRALTLQIMG